MKNQELILKKFERRKILINLLLLLLSLIKYLFITYQLSNNRFCYRFSDKMSLKSRNEIKHCSSISKNFVFGVYELDNFLIGK